MQLTLYTTSNTTRRLSTSSVPCQILPSAPSEQPSPQSEQPSPRTFPRPGCGRLLPEECIQEIFDYLTNDVSTLHALLLVSKTFFRIAMPLLYVSPFDLLESNQNWSPQERTKRHASLLYLLMNCCSKERDDQQETQESDDEATKECRPLWADLPPVCPTFQDANKSLKTPLVDYLSAYHRHYLCMNLSSTFPIVFPNIQRYLPSHSLASSVSPSLQLGNTTITMFTRNEIERAFLLHRPALVKTISLPIQRLAAFQSIWPKLSSLVRFELYGVSWHFNLDPAIEFLQQHSRLFGTIRELKMAGPNDVRLLQKPSLHRIMKAIKCPKVIDLSRYKEATKDLNSFEIQNVSGLEQLLFDLEFVPLPQSPSSPVFEPPESILSNTTTGILTAATSSQIKDGAQRGHRQEDHTLDLIRQCTNLTTLQIGVQTPNAFSWAVDRYDADPSSLQQLKALHLSSNRTVTVQKVLEDCVYAFRDTLEDLKGVALKLSAVAPSLSESDASFGWSWPLNRLSVLSLKGELAVWFDFESLKYCPKLSELYLTLHPYSPPEFDHLDKVSLATQLTTLSFVGRWILSDGLMSKLGGSLQRLKDLKVDGCDVDALTRYGLINALDRMKALKRVNVDLGQRIEAAMREYRTLRTGLEIFPQPDEAPRS
ncbi:hypothetical protein EDD21DRAFT_385337 [Dissophora ornata]|nr:hypothetical protein EDD21DRAFT_385337 [Dissophora ornata]